MKEQIIIIQASLNPRSKTAILARKALEILEQQNINVKLIDLRERELQFCTGADISDYNEDMQQLNKELEEATQYILAYPVYNYTFSGTLKNFLDIFSSAIDGKTVGILNNSSGVRSWNQGVGELMKSLALHNNITTVMPPVHSFREDFNEEGRLSNPKVSEKIELMTKNLLNFS